MKKTSVIFAAIVTFLGTDASTIFADTQGSITATVASTNVTPTLVTGPSYDFGQLSYQFGDNGKALLTSAIAPASTDFSIQTLNPTGTYALQDSVKDLPAGAIFAIGDDILSSSAVQLGNQLVPGTFNYI